MIRSSLFAAALAVSLPAHADLGDADSFGRGVKWLGLVSGNVQLTDDCSPEGEPALENCAELAPTGTTVFDFPDLDTIRIAGRSSESLLCHWQTPVVNYGAFNPGPAAETFSLRAVPYYVVESPVLDDVVDPGTGLPLGGRIELSLAGVQRSRTLQPGEQDNDLITGTRTCIGGLLNRQTLQGAYGLTAAQARRFFRQPITIRIGIRGQAQNVLYSNINFGTRFLGD